MADMGVGLFLQREERSVRRRVLIRSALAVVAGPSSAVGATVLAGQSGLVPAPVDVGSVLLFGMLVSTVAVSGLVVVTLLLARPLPAFLGAAALAWLLVTVALVGGGDRWVDGVVLSSCLVAVPVGVVLLAVREPLETWQRYESPFT